MFNTVKFWFNDAQLWSYLAGTGGPCEHSWVCILASTKPYRVQACSDTLLSRHRTHAWKYQILVSVPILAGLAQVGTLFSQFTKYLFRIIDNTEIIFFQVTNEQEVDWKCCVSFFLNLAWTRTARILHNTTSGTSVLNYKTRIVACRCMCIRV